MRAVFRRILVFAALQCLVVLSTHALFYATPLNRNLLLEWKLQLLRENQTAQGKLVIIGGSNARYGFDSALLSAIVGRPVVNASATVHEGLYLYLDAAKRHLRRGDVLLMSPEYVNLDEERFFGSHKVVLDAWVYPGFYFLMGSDPVALRGFVYNTPWHLSNLYDAIVHLRPFEVLDRRRNLIAKHTALGDWNAYEDAAKFADFPVTISEPSSRVLGHLQREIAELAARGVTCLWVYPPVRSDSLREEFSLAQVHTVLTSRIRELTVLGHPRGSVSAASDFYDSPYHLNREAAEARTQEIGSMVVKALQ